MRTQNFFTGTMPLGIAVAAGLALCFLAVTDAAAQRGGFGGPPLAPEKAEAAWKLQADSASIGLKLDSKEQSEKVREAYMAARNSHQKAMGELRSSIGGGGGREMFQAFRELNQKERAKLSEALDTFLSEEQTTQTMASLGTFSRTWDRYVDVLAGFEFEGKELYSALKLLQIHTVDSDKARSEAIANQDFQSMRSMRQELKAKLDTDLADVLSEEQLAKWKEQTPARGPGGRPGGGPRR